MSRPIPLWLGATLPVWAALVRRHRFSVRGARRGHVLLPSLMAPLNSLAAATQDLVFGRRIDAVAIDPPPVFVTGFFRTGTTLMHELLACDPRTTAPSMSQCLAPEHFLVSWPTRVIVAPFMADRRPMDEMAWDLDRPFEDEFALYLSGVDSPYEFFFFPATVRSPIATYGDGPDEPAWRPTLVRFLKAVLLARPGRLVLKSPPHGARAGRLAEMFPGARFVHMVRHPLTMVPSAIHMVRVLNDHYGFQRAPAAAIEDWVFRHCELMHRHAAEARARLGPERFMTVRYEDLVADPVAWLERIYAGIELGSFEPARAAVEGHLAAIAGYRTNRFASDEPLRRRILDRCGWIMREYGYRP